MRVTDGSWLTCYVKRMTKAELQAVIRAMPYARRAHPDWIARALNAELRHHIISNRRDHYDGLSRNGHGAVIGVDLARGADTSVTRLVGGHNRIGGECLSAVTAGRGAAMREKSMIFSVPMVRALLDGSKTQTRRVFWTRKDLPPPHSVARNGSGFIACWDGGARHDIEHLPKSGDRLWVREAWQEFFQDELPPERQSSNAGRMGIPACPGRRSVVGFRADGELPDHPQHGKAIWRPSIHMPRWASRLTLTVTDVRVQRLQEISSTDAGAEGCPGYYNAPGADPDLTDDETVLGQFRTLWDTLNARRGFGWDENPWVVAYSFTVGRGNIDAVPS
ncbi:hypothetical protein [Oceaniglobus trochenteri]|uniref:hypothetical protein n=1 Tax=Oceaniglobus trochenteri TaxID=2763260 RepID=UPI001CFFC4CF|nr:hypothetical protein [Oceaniglobus trochenteri]